MNRVTVFLGSLIFVLLLVSCGTTAASNGSVGTAALKDDYADALTVPVQLALGSLKLEETDLAISEEQGTELVPLWQAYQSLSASDKAAEAEISAVLKQIQSAMTSEQMETIASMALTSEDLNTSMNELAGLIGRGGFFVSRGEGNQTDDGGPGGDFPRGGFPSGGIPGEGFAVEGPGGGLGRGMGWAMGGDQTGAGSEARATQIAELGGDADDLMSVFMNEALISVLIRTLQIKTGELDATAFGPGRMDPVLLNVVSETTGIPLETLHMDTASGATLADVITAQRGDLEAVKTALREALSEAGWAADGLDQRIDGLLNNAVRQAPPEE